MKNVCFICNIDRCGVASCVSAAACHTNMAARATFERSTANGFDSHIRNDHWCAPQGRVRDLGGGPSSIRFAARFRFVFGIYAVCLTPVTNTCVFVATYVSVSAGCGTTSIWLCTFRYARRASLDVARGPLSGWFGS